MISAGIMCQDTYSIMDYEGKDWDGEVTIMSLC